MKPETGKLKAETLKCGLASLRLATVLLTLAFSLYPLAFPLRAAQFFVDSVTGSDANTSVQAQSPNTPWAHLPGMSGATGNAAGYSVQSGDSFCLKGGSTWTFASTTADLLAIPASGITLQGGQQLATPWGSGYPVLDGSGSTTTRAAISASGKTGVTIDGLKLANTLYSADGSGFGLEVYGAASNWEIKNCLILNCGVDGVAFGPGTGSSPDNESGFLFHGNILTNCGRFFWAIGDPTAFDDVEIFSNRFYGPGPVALGSYHSDGIMIGASSTHNPSLLTHVSIHHNRFSGDWAQGATALIYLNDGASGPLTQYGGSHCLIYDNQLCIDSAGIISPGFITIYSRWQDVQIYNNTLALNQPGNDCNAINAGYNVSGAGIVITNNIMAGFKTGIVAEDLQHGSGLEADYNLYFMDGSDTGYFYDSAGEYQSLAAMRTAGYEAHGQVANPLFVALPNSTTGSGNWHLQAGSPAIGAGFNLGSPYNVDLDGNTRTAPWSLGAFVAPGLGASINGGRIHGGVILH